MGLSHQSRVAMVQLPVEMWSFRHLGNFDLIPSLCFSLYSFYIFTSSYIDILKVAIKIIFEKF